MTTSCSARCAHAQMREELEARRQARRQTGHSGAEAWLILTVLPPKTCLQLQEDQEFDKRTQLGHPAKSAIGHGGRAKPYPSKKLGGHWKWTGACKILCSDWGEPKGNREQLGPVPACFRAEGAYREGMGSELK